MTNLFKKSALAVNLKWGILVAIVPWLIAFNEVQTESEEVNLYSYRQPFLIRPLLDAFTAETGIDVNVTFAKNGIVDKILAAGANNPADAVLTVDISRLRALQRAKLLEPVSSAVINAAVPAHFRHPDGLWFGLTIRARVILAHLDRVPPNAIQSLASLTAKRFRGRICTRSGKHVYNTGLIASVIARDGEVAAERWLRGIKANLARKPQGNDRAQIKAIYQGRCDLAIVNHYYIGKMATNEKKPEQQTWANAVRVVFLDQQGRGQHVNISAAGVIKTGKNKRNAVKLIEFLISEKAQNIYAQDNFEYPVRAGVALHPLLASWGEFKVDEANLNTVSAYLPAAARLVDRVGFDNGP